MAEVLGDTQVSEPAPVLARVPSQTALALLDLVAGARAPHLWRVLGWQDIRQRYRRSKLGPFWLTISTGVLVGTLGVLYAALFKVEVANYLPFVAVGFLVWGLISGLINDGCAAFIGAGTIIKQVELPLSVHVYRVVWRNFIVFAHNAVIFVVVAVVFSIWPGWTGLLALPGLAASLPEWHMDRAASWPGVGPLPRRSADSGQRHAGRVLSYANHLET